MLKIFHSIKRLAGLCEEAYGKAFEHFFGKALSDPRRRIVLDVRYTWWDFLPVSVQSFCQQKVILIIVRDSSTSLENRP